MKNINALSDAYFSYAVDLRRELHQNPEPSLLEERTSRRVVEELNKIGLEAKKIAGTAVIAEIEGNTSGKTVALRADMDALELVEETELPYKSKAVGLMHACGHDAHTASLLTAAKILSELKTSFPGKIKLIFQPGEEIALGAKKIISTGVLSDVDAIFGIHIWNEVPSGRIAIDAGARMAAVSKFTIDVIGQGGHGSMPHQGIDAIAAASAIVLNLQSIVSREIDPMEAAVLTVGVLNSGTTYNILAGKAHLEGTTRCFNQDVNEQLPLMIKRVASDTAKAYRAEIKTDYQNLTLVVKNDQYLTLLGKHAVQELFGPSVLFNLKPTTGGEDFSFYAKEAPSLFAFVGGRNEMKLPYYPHHHPKFDIDEDAIKQATALYAKFAIDFLNDTET
ncbi:amidohydrolase [Sediminispirochaeta smaragdinae]|uniref:Amidohydrolase n=1 Tax=Sediminispirochaeta smaragdinae (strain DSM 11293 / JCM 15392 / SEBR 4228) TaxID=573413 RepID=E1R8S5_SEDSS|nr:amidohydrolase [Sediminispirochaeta smaragdinae]ADK81832.1 amidohydrolase [Sediminispirochaeta smaragdinae DSM 11293]